MTATAATLPPIVYAGTSLSPAEVGEYLPGAQVMPPVRRGDLYRDRMLGFQVFVILDGVFYHNLAVPPREVLDLLADDANLVGASSMGAIRAAECWPAGMQGVGTIYRLFRRGVLGSDDEVAVAFGPVQPHRMSTVALVNVRFAASRARRCGLLNRRQAERLVRVAADTFYAERMWRTLLSDAGIDDPDGRLRSALSKWDLKRADARRALEATARRLTREPDLLDGAARSPRLFVPNEFRRERGHDAFGPGGAAALKPRLWRWLLFSGRFRRFPWLAVDPASFPPAEGLSDEDWSRLAERGELEALAFRCRAIGEAAGIARKQGLKPRPSHRQQAQMEIACEHGYDDWRGLQADFDDRPGWRDGIRDCLDELSLAKAFRDRLFPAGEPCGGPRPVGHH